MLQCTRGLLMATENVNYNRPPLHKQANTTVCLQLVCVCTSVYGCVSVVRKRGSKKPLNNLIWLEMLSVSGVHLKSVTFCKINQSY